MGYLPLVTLFALGLPALLLPDTAASLVCAAYRGRGQARYLLLGITAGVIAHRLLRNRQTYRFLNTLQHELAHLLMGLVLMVAPTSLHTTHGAGEVQYEISGPFGRSRSFCISLAPYWFSPWILLPMFASVLPAPAAGWPRLVVGFLTGIALSLPIAQIHREQPDLTRYGFWQPLVVAAWLWAAELTLVLRLVQRWDTMFALRAYSTAWNLLT